MDLITKGGAEERGEWGKEDCNISKHSRKEANKGLNVAKDKVEKDKRPGVEDCREGIHRCKGTIIKRKHDDNLIKKFKYLLTN